MHTLNLIGAGRVAQTLARLWHQHGVLVVQDVLTTALPSAQAACRSIGAGQPVSALAEMRPADIWMLATPDAQIADAAQALATSGHGGEGEGGDAIAVHCSGALASDVLAPLATRGWRTSSAHCILSFADVDAAVRQFPGTACALEGDAPACATLQGLFSEIGARCFALRGQDKLLYHAAAVFATNFLPVLQTVAEAAWTATGVPAALIPSLRNTLLANAVANITTLGPAAALTGPAARGDTAAIARQAQAVAAWDPAAGAAYEALSALALRIAAERSATK